MRVDLAGQNQNGKTLEKITLNISNLRRFCRQKQKCSWLFEPLFFLLKKIRRVDSEIEETRGQTELTPIGEEDPLPNQVLISSIVSCLNFFNYMFLFLIQDEK